MKTVFFGTPQFAVASLEALLRSTHDVALVVAQPDRPAGRGMKLHKPPVIEVAEREGIPTLQPPKLRDEAFLTALRELAPDAGVVVAYGKILPDSLLSIPKHGFINVHGSLLPKYRGAAPIQRAIEAGEKESGVTIMLLDREMDHGPVLAMQSLAIGDDEHTPALAARLAVSGGALLVDVLDALERGEAKPVEQDHAAATYAAKIEKEEGAVDWNAFARTTYDKFRAFDPWPGIYAPLGDEVVKLTDVAVVAGGGNAGTITQITHDGVAVATSEGALLIRQMQRPGKRPAAAAEIVRSRGLGPGDRFA
ncbi:MAG: methionyl-tRNA formyltransferase [Thermoanaerobaculia bacterium]